MNAYYNENDPFAAAWLRNLIAGGHIAPGFVDERDIRDVQPADLAGYAQHHFFAGIGGWSYALRLAGWPDDRPVWTGSCPCQPFSAAGKRGGLEDSRHLWPAWFRLIRECRPPVVFGEQVASKDGLAWFDHVATDLEAEAYAVGAADLCAASVGAPHIRQRLWFVADAERDGDDAHGRDATEPRRYEPADGLSGRGGGVLRGTVADRLGAGLEVERIEQARRERAPVERGGTAGVLDDSERDRWRASGHDHGGNDRLKSAAAGDPWHSIVWLPCRDGKARPTQPGLFPLAHGVSARMGRLRGYGNAIVPQVAAEFIRAYEEVREAQCQT